MHHGSAIVYYIYNRHNQFEIVSIFMSIHCRRKKLPQFQVGTKCSYSSMFLCKLQYKWNQFYFKQSIARSRTPVFLHAAVLTASVYLFCNVTEKIQTLHICVYILCKCSGNLILCLISENMFHSNDGPIRHNQTENPDCADYLM